ncbi:MAG: orotate phosphoribosyltransferase [Actinomycetota bacterium]|nr:orotate phosphoribosyltransferase [Actinomycetota bacterium]
MNPTEVLEVLETRGAVLKGHFVLSSGRHSDLFVQKFRVFEDPRLTQSFGEAIASRFGGDFDVVASPAVGAIVLGFATALAADRRAIFAERVDDRFLFRRGFAIKPHERTLIVEDVVTTGGSAREIVRLVRASAGVPVGIGALIDRSHAEEHLDLGAPMKALLRLETTTWSPEDCPLCAASAPLSDLGSRWL